MCMHLTEIIFEHQRHHLAWQLPLFIFLPFVQLRRPNTTEAPPQNYLPHHWLVFLRPLADAPSNMHALGP